MNANPGTVPEKPLKTPKKIAKDDFTQGPISFRLLVFCLPIIASGLLQLLYNMADSIVVGNFVGVEALAAVNSTGSLTSLIISLALGLSVGASVSVAHAVGSKRETEAQNIIHTSFLLSIVAGVAIGLFGFFTARFWLKLMNSPDDVIELSTLYLKIVFLGMPANFIYNYGAAILRSKGDSKNPLIFLSISGLVNVALNLVLVICFGFDVDGVGIATIVSQYLSAAMILIHMYRLKGFFHFSPKKLAFHKKELLKILYIGIPSGIQSTLFSVSNVIIQSSVNSFGSVVMAGNSAAQGIEGFIYTAMNSIYQGNIVFSGQNFGAKKFDRVRKCLISSLIIVTIVGIILAGFFIIFKDQAFGLYVKKDAEARDEVLAKAALRFMIIAPTYFLCGLMDVTCASLRSIGKSITSMIITVFGACGLRILWIYTIFAAFRDSGISIGSWHLTGLDVLYWSYPISWLITFLVELTFFIVSLKNLERLDSLKLYERFDQ